MLNLMFFINFLCFLYAQKWKKLNSAFGEKHRGKDIGGEMSTRKSARQFVDTSNQGQNSTTSLFIKNHTSPTQLLSQVRMLFAEGHLHEAQHVMECIIDNYNPLISSADLFVLNAKVDIELHGFNVHAKCALQQALLLEPQHEEALKLSAVSQHHDELRDGLYETATEALRKQLQQDPNDVYAMYVLANHLFWKNGPEQEATSLLEKAVKLRPSFLKAWLCLAMAYKKAQDLGKAEGAFQECLSLDTNATNQEFYKKHLQSL